MAVRGRATAAGVTFDIANYAFFVLLSLTFIYPFWTIITQSFAPIHSVHSMGFHVWPGEIDTEAWSYVFDEHAVAPAYFNTLFRVVFGVLLTLLVTFTAAYALSKPTLPWRKSLTLIYTLTLFFAGGIIPLFLLIRSLELFNTRAVLIMVPAINVFWIVLARNYLMTIDQAMEDSAVIDGATYWTVLWRIIAPLAKPVIAVVALFSAVQHWNSWFDALIYAPHPRLIVLQMLVFRMLTDLRSDWFIEYQEMMRQAGIDVEMFAAEAVQAATIVLTIGPIILVYPFLQRFFVKGVMLGSLKG